MMIRNRRSGLIPGLTTFASPLLVLSSAIAAAQEAHPTEQNDEEEPALSRACACRSKTPRTSSAMPPRW